MQDLVSGRIEAVVIDELVALAIATENPGYQAIPFLYKDGAPVTEQFAACVAKGNEDLLAEIDGAITEILENGEIDSYFDMFEE
jgi:polar amino acid transport system substrate-binding protein